MVMARHLKSLDARVAAILVNSTPDKDLSTSRIDSVAVSYAGMEGESHSGLVRASCVRVRHQYPQGTEIRNTRQISIVSVEELTLIAANMGVDGLQALLVGGHFRLAGPDHQQRRRAAAPGMDRPRQLRCSIR